MLEGLRAEFPAIARLRRPAVAREALPWAFASAVGAAFLTTAIVSLVLGAWLFPILFPPTREHPGWLSPGLFATEASMLMAGAVAVRAGGPAAVLLFIAYELLVFLAGLPGRIAFCERATFSRGDLFGVDPCDQLALLLAKWPQLAALLTGALVSPWLVSASGRGANRMLRGAGAFALVAAVLSLALGLVLAGSAPAEQIATSGLAIGLYLAAGVAGGIVLARASLARAVLVALLVAAPAVTVNLPFVRAQAERPQPAELLVAQLATLLGLLLAAALLLLVRAYVRGRRAPAA